MHFRRFVQICLRWLMFVSMLRWLKLKVKLTSSGCGSLGMVCLGRGGCPRRQWHFPCPPVITGGPGTSLLGCFFVFFYILFLPALVTSGRCASLVPLCLITWQNSSASSKRNRRSGLEFLQQRQSSLCFSSCCGRLGSLGSTPRNNGNDCETRSLLMPRHKSKSSCEVFDHPGLIPSSWLWCKDACCQLHCKNKTYFHIWSGITTEFFLSGSDYVAWKWTRTRTRSALGRLSVSN